MWLFLGFVDDPFDLVPYLLDDLFDLFFCVADLLLGLAGATIGLALRFEILVSG
jgi:hypothetical protein